MKRKFALFPLAAVLPFITASFTVKPTKDPSNTDNGSFRADKEIQEASHDFADQREMIPLGNKGECSIECFSAGEGFIRYKPLGKRMFSPSERNLFFFSVRIPGYEFKKSIDKFIARSTFASTITNYDLVYEEYIISGHQDPIYEPESNFYVTQYEDIFVFAVRFNYPKDPMPEGYEYKQYEYKDITIEFPTKYTPTFASLSSNMELNASIEDKHIPVEGLRWQGNVLVAFLDKTYDKSQKKYMHPIKLLSHLYPLGEKTEKGRSFILTGIDKDFGDYYWYPKLIDNGKVRTYKFYAKEYDKQNNTYKEEKEYWIKVCTTDDVEPRILIDGIDADSINYPIRISYTEYKKYGERRVSDMILSHVSVIDNSNEYVQKAVFFEKYIGYMKLGSFFVTIDALDSGRNLAIARKEILIVDDVPPVITIPAEEIKVTTDVRLSDKEIFDHVIATDEMCEEVSLSFGKNPYHADGNYAKPGIYRVEIIATDKYGNSSRKELPIVVEDPNNDNWVLSEGTVIVATNTVLKPMDIVERLVKDRQLENLKYTSAMIIEGPPLEGNNTPGDHTITIEAEIEGGGSKFIVLTVRVLDKSNFEAGDTEEVQTTFTFWENLVHFFNSIIAFFKGLFGIS